MLGVYNVKSGIACYLPRAMLTDIFLSCFPVLRGSWRFAIILVQLEMKCHETVRLRDDKELLEYVVTLKVLQGGY